jgi:hypothetical protein
MNKRIAKKRAAVWVCRVLSIPTALSHARSNYFALPYREQRRSLCRVMHRQLDIPMGVARRATTIRESLEEMIKGFSIGP